MADLKGMEPTTIGGATEARPLHLVPVRTGWAIIEAGSERPLAVCADIGSALDAAAARSRGRLHLVVHARQAG